MKNKKIVDVIFPIKYYTALTYIMPVLDLKSYIIGGSTAIWLRTNDNNIIPNDIDIIVPNLDDIDMHKIFTEYDYEIEKQTHAKRLNKTMKCHIYVPNTTFYTNNLADDEYIDIVIDFIENPNADFSDKYTFTVETIENVKKYRQQLYEFYKSQYNEEVTKWKKDSN